jgi:RNA polymerase sigma-70 factor, ECF subfamily
LAFEPGRGGRRGPRAAELAALRECLQRLPPASGEIVRDHYFDNHTAEEIAGRQGKRGGAVRMLLLRIRRGLAECVRRRLAGEVRP